MSDTPRTFGYVRASTKKQIDSPDTQKDIIAKYAAMQELDEPTFFVDAAVSGKVPIEERPAGAALFTQLRPGDHLILAKLDRGFRKLSDCVRVLEKLERLGVNLHVCNLMGGALDLGSPMGKFIVHVLAAFAELERAFISERTKEGLKGKKRQGFAHARHPGYGFRWEKRRIDGKVQKVKVADLAEREVMRAIVGWRMQDGPLSWKQIADHLNYGLKIRTKDNALWNECRIRRAHHAELLLQLQAGRIT